MNIKSSTGLIATTKSA